MVSRIGLYTLGSTLLFTGVVAYAWQTREQKFFPTVIYLVTSKFSIMVLGNMALVLTLLFGRFTKALFLGSLRDAEVEILYENSRYAITETCLALTIFREEINLRVVALFTALLFAKIFHWLCQSRIEYIEQAEAVSRLTHLRLVALMSTLAIMDSAFVAVCSYMVFEDGPSVLILFGFEFLVLLITLISIFFRYILHLLDLRVDGTWHNKAAFLFYLELATEVTRLFVYVIFFLIIFSYYGLPLHIVRDLWVSIRNLERRLSAYFRYRRLTSNMNERFPDASEEELNETDHVCIICREEMQLGSAKKLPCSHIFHFYCLRMWLQRQQTCPTCRADIPSDDPPPRPAPPNPEAVPADNAGADQPAERRQDPMPDQAQAQPAVEPRPQAFQPPFVAAPPPRPVANTPMRPPARPAADIPPPAQQHGGGATPVSMSSTPQPTAAASAPNTFGLPDLGMPPTIPNIHFNMYSPAVVGQGAFPGSFELPGLSPMFQPLGALYPPGQFFGPGQIPGFVGPTEHPGGIPTMGHMGPFFPHPFMGHQSLSGVQSFNNATAGTGVRLLSADEISTMDTVELQQRIAEMQAHISGLMRQMQASAAGASAAGASRGPSQGASTGLGRPEGAEESKTTLEGDKADSMSAPLLEEVEEEAKEEPQPYTERFSVPEDTPVPPATIVASEDGARQLDSAEQLRQLRLRMFEKKPSAAEEQE